MNTIISFFLYLVYALQEWTRGARVAGFREWVHQAAENDELIYEAMEPDWSEGPDIGWMCACGHWEPSEFHCSNCGNEPAWGCDCCACYRLEEETGDEPGILASSFDFADGDDEDEEGEWPY